MTRLTRRDFFMGLVAVGLARGLPLPAGIKRELPVLEIGQWEGVRWWRNDSGLVLHADAPLGWTQAQKKRPTI